MPAPTSSCPDGLAGRTARRQRVLRRAPRPRPRPAHRRPGHVPRARADRRQRPARSTSSSPPASAAIVADARERGRRASPRSPVPTDAAPRPTAPSTSFETHLRAEGSFVVAGERSDRPARRRQGRRLRPAGRQGRRRAAPPHRAARRRPRRAGRPGQRRRRRRPARRASDPHRSLRRLRAALRADQPVQPGPHRAHRPGDGRGDHAPSPAAHGRVPRTTPTGRSSPRSRSSTTRPRTPDPAAIFTDRVIDPPHRAPRRRHRRRSRRRLPRRVRDRHHRPGRRAARHRPGTARDRARRPRLRRPRPTARSSRPRSTCRATSATSSTPPTPAIHDGRELDAERHRPRTGPAPPARAGRDRRPARRSLDPGRGRRARSAARSSAPRSTSSTSPQLGQWSARAARRQSPRRRPVLGVGNRARRRHHAARRGAQPAAAHRHRRDRGRATRVRNDAETLAAREKQEALATGSPPGCGKTPNAPPGSPTATTSCSRSPSCPTTTAPPHPARPRRHRSRPARTSATPSPGSSPTAASLLAHAVGAGKTATMVMAAMELRRLGLGRQAGRRRAEPHARAVLPRVAPALPDRPHPRRRPRRLSKDRRKEFVARAPPATGTASCSPTPGSSASRSAATSCAATSARRSRPPAGRSPRSKGGKGLSVKRLERRSPRSRRPTSGSSPSTPRTTASASRRPASTTCSSTRPTSSRTAASTRDRRRRRRRLAAGPGPRRQAVGAASRARAPGRHVRHRHPDRQLDGRAVGHADLPPARRARRRRHASRSTRGPPPSAGPSTALELAPDGGSYRMHTRFARFHNVPELLTLYRQVADVRTAEDLDLPTPALAGGKPETVVVAGSDELVDYVADLAARAERDPQPGGRPDRGQHAQGHRRRPPRRARPPPRRRRRPIPTAASSPSPPSASPRSTTTPATPPTSTSTASPRPGRVRCSSCSATSPPPPATGWNAYDELRDAARRPRRADRADPLHARAPATDEAKAKLFAACRDGRVAVLIGSTEKMGVGTNVQARADRAAPPRLPVAAGRHRTARGPHPPPGQPERRGPGPPLRHRRQLRHLHVADRRAEGRLHRPGHAAATSPTARSTTSATRPSPTPRSRPSPPATRSSSRRPASTPTSPGSPASNAPTTTTSTASAARSRPHRTEPRPCAAPGRPARGRARASGRHPRRPLRDDRRRPAPHQAHGRRRRPQDAAGPRLEATPPETTTPLTEVATTRRASSSPPDDHRDRGRGPRSSSPTPTSN